MRTRRARCAPGLKRSCLPVLSPALQPFYCSGRDRVAWLSAGLPRRCRQLSPLRMECSSTGGFLVIACPGLVGLGDGAHRGRTMAEGGGVDQRGAEGHGRGGGQLGHAGRVAEARAAGNDGVRDGQQVDVDVFPAGLVAGVLLRQCPQGTHRTEMAGDGRTVAHERAGVLGVVVLAHGFSWLRADIGGNPRAAGKIRGILILSAAPGNVQKTSKSTSCYDTRF